MGYGLEKGMSEMQLQIDGADSERCLIFLSSSGSSE